MGVAASAVTFLPGPKRSEIVSGFLVCSMLPWNLLCLQTSNDVMQYYTYLHVGQNLVFRASYNIT